MRNLDRIEWNKMEVQIHQIFQHELNEAIYALNEIKVLGSVNKVYEIKGHHGKYVIRLNEDKQLEYKKEPWCLAKVRDLGILALG